MEKTVDLIEMGMEKEAVGDLAGALECYESSLIRDPSSGRINFLRGNVLVALVRYEEALDAFDRALEVKPNSVGALFDRGDVCERLGRWAEAESAYCKALEVDPGFADALVGLGNVYESLGKKKDAITCFQRAIRLKPDYREVYLSLASVLREIGNTAEARFILQEAVSRFPKDHHTRFTLATLLVDDGLPSEALEHVSIVTLELPEFAQALALQGDVLQSLGKCDAAIVCYQRALLIDENDLRILNNLGAAQKQIGLLEESAITFRRAITLKPDFADGLSNLGAILKNLGQLDEALECFQRAVMINPKFDEAYHNFGLALSEIGRYDEAADCYSKAVEINPERFESLSNLGAMYTYIGKLERAESCFRQLIEKQENNPDAHVGLGVVMKDYGRLDEAVGSLQKAIQIDPERHNAYSILLFASHYLPEVPHSELLSYAQRYGEIVSKKSNVFDAWNVEPIHDRPLRVGIVSGDLGRHPVGCFLVAVLEALVARFGKSLSFHAYASRLHNDSLSERLKKSFSSWLPVAGLSDEGLARRIHADQVDILIDLSGHSAFNRLPVFAWKPAPVQVTWLGYFATTGVAEIDYLIADPWTLPVSEEQFFTEKVWRLPETRLCFSPPEEMVPVSLLPALSNRFVTFGCFNNLSKLTDEVLLLWAEILHMVPGSRLLLKALQFSDESVRLQVLERFYVLGIGADRLMLEPYEARDKYLSAYHRVDIGLDPFPYTGGTTTVESLWMGVPVITLEGKHFLSRQGVGLLANTGLSTWIAKDKRSYVTTAVSQASNLSNLAFLRSQLRNQVLSSPIFNADRFSVHFENALRSMWIRWCDVRRARQE